ncbi:acyl-CoA-binding domain-containing protein 3-like [Euphorbia lathyris]|uniref:acyl-CoA-binding domain-containing protein 3-like n=1 Tax=Euphorbia lathyris TaxID=212925 RepID=UPI0033139A74
MELLQELLLTALIAVFFSFLIAKLVSMAMARGDCSRNPQVSETQNLYRNIVGDTTEEDTQYCERLQVDQFKSEKKVEFVAEEAQMIDRILKGSVEVEEIEKSAKSDEVIQAECCELPPKSIEEISEVISGSDVDEFQVNSEFGVNFPEDNTAIKLAEQVVDEKEIVGDDNLLEENIKIGMELSVEKDVIEESEEIQAEDIEAKRKADEKQIKIDSDDDDWEGIERSELENIFAKATKFMEDEDLTSAGSDVQMELYGLHKVATEGPCREHAPMPLKVGARAKWNAWQRLGNMSPEVAMEKYVALVSDNVHAWKEDKFVGDGKPEPLEVETIGVVTSDKSIPSYNHLNYTEQSKNAEDVPSTARDDLTGEPNLESLAKE